MGDIAVSLIIPMYNAEKHLKECLDSCVNQTLTGLEIICINDGSTDGTAKILEYYNKRYANMIVIEQRNQGSGAARNLGIKYAKGQFIAFMDSDDYYPNNDVLRKLYEKAVRKNVNICGGSDLLLQDGELRFNDRKNRSKSHFKEDKEMRYSEYQFACAYIQFIYNTKFLKDNQILFPEYRRFQDALFFVKAMTCAERFFVISEGVYVIRNTDKIIRYDDEEILSGILSGISDILDISRIERFEILHTDMVVELMEKFIGYVYKAIYRGSMDIRNRYEKLLTNIDEMLLHSDSRRLDKPKLMSDDDIQKIINNSLIREKKLMKKVNSFATILIYGAGVAGRFLCDYIVEKGYAGNIRFMVSSRNPQSTSCGKVVKSIFDCINDKEDVLVLIANKDNGKVMEENARKYEFKNIEYIPYDELMLFGADITNDSYISIFK